MQCSGLQIFSFLLLLCGTILIGISICTNSWFITRPLDQSTIGLPGKPLVDVEKGLWGYCKRHPVTEIIGIGSQVNEECGNRYEKTRQELMNEREHVEEIDKGSVKIKVWEIVVLALMCASACTGILSLLFSPCCCNRCGCCLAVFVFTAAVFCAGGVCTYAYYSWTSHAEKVEDHVQQLKQFGWSYWCAVAGGTCQFFSGILFAISRCRQHSYSHTV